MSRYWTALQVLNQVSGELGLPQVKTIVGVENAQSIQLLAMLNSSGNELMLYYPWEQFHKEWLLDLQTDQSDYELPVDWNYAIDQTQWDRTNHWPLVGPKSPQEWAWLKGGLLSAAPRIRFRISDNKFMLWPKPTADQRPSGSANWLLSLEYIIKNWLITSPPDAAPYESDMIQLDSDVLRYDPWLLVKYVKFKFYELKGFDTTSVQADFMRMFNTLTGKDTGAPILSLAPQGVSMYIGPWSVPDGSWQTGQP
jgi:hypothetical protein